MRESGPTAENYYDDYFGWDIRLMTAKLKRIEASESIPELKEKEEALLVVLGSATPENLQYIARLDEYLRPGKSSGDRAVIVDSSIYTLQKHQRVPELTNPDGAAQELLGLPKEEEGKPKLEVVAGDMRELPFESGKVDVVISDYTFNFLDNFDDVEQSFREISRILTEKGTLLISIEGNPDYPFKRHADSPAEAPIKDKARPMRGGAVIHAFPLSAYIAAAEKAGLILEKYDTFGNDICGLFKKQSNPAET